MRELDLSMRICGFMLFNHKEKTDEHQHER
jgi:hypothetical protein